MKIRERDTAKQASKTGIDGVEARLEAKFEKVRRDLTIDGAVIISAWVGFLLAVKFFG